MTREQLLQKRAKLVAHLQSCESGRLTHQDEDEAGQLRRDVTAEQIESLKQSISDIDRQLGEMPGAGE